MVEQACRGRQSALRKGRISLRDQVYHITSTSSGRAPLFGDFWTASVVCRCFEDPVLLGESKVLAWVLMPDHAHWLLQLGPTEDLGCTVNRLKSRSAREANEIRGSAGSLWSRGYYDHAMRSDESLRAAARYIVNNPLRAGLVQSLGDYPFWNTAWDWFPFST